MLPRSFRTTLVWNRRRRRPVATTPTAREIWNEFHPYSSNINNNNVLETRTRSSFGQISLHIGRCHRHLSTASIGDQSSRKKIVRSPTAKRWNEQIERLLDVNMYPIGFSNMPQSISLVTSWCQQVSRVLQQTSEMAVVPSDPNISTVEPALRLLDRLFLEQDAHNKGLPKADSSGGVLMSPDISSSAIAAALATWKLSLEYSNSSKLNHDPSLAWERVSRYGNFLANHEGSMLSQISKVIDPVKRQTDTSRSTLQPVEASLDTDVIENTTATVNYISADTQNSTNEVRQEALLTETQQEASEKTTFDFDDNHLLGIPLQRFNKRDSSVDDLIKERNVVVENNDRNLDASLADGSEIDATMPFDDEVAYGRALLAVNHWDATFDRLLNLTEFPIGFSKSVDPGTADLWFSEAEQLLWLTTPSTIQQALEVLDRWCCEQNSNTTTEPKRTYPMASLALNHVLQCWLSCLQEDDTVRDVLTPEFIWDKISSLRITHPQGHDETALSLVVKAVGLIEAPENAPIRADAILQAHVKSLAASDIDMHGAVHLNSTCVRSLLKLWQQSQLPAAPSEADRLLSMLTEWYNKYQRTSQIPDDEVYAAIISIWVAGASPGKAIYRAEILMNEMRREPSFIVLGTFIDALAKVGHVERAHTLLNKYILAQTDVLEERPRSFETIKMFDGCNPILSIFEAYRNRLDRQPLVAIVQMERFVTQLEKLTSDHEEMRSVFHPNVACYNVLIRGYSHLRTHHKAEGLLGHVMRLLNESTDKVIAADSNNNQPAVTLFNNVLDALVLSGDAEAVPRAIALVANMEMKCRNDPFYQPNDETYSLLLYCIAYDRRNTIVNNAREVEQLLERMINDTTGYIPKPSADCYDIVLRTWCRAGYPDHAESMLLKLCDDRCALLDSSNGTITNKALPTSVQFLIVMQGWVSVARRRNNSHQSLSRVEQLLQKMHDMYLKGFQTKPTVTAHNMFLECLSKSEESYAPEKAESFLLLMLKLGREDPSLVPDVVIYNSVLNTWLRSNRYDAPLKASALFKKMRTMKDSTVRVINATSYVTMMGIYTQHALPHKVQEVFDELMESEDSTLRIPLSAYSTLLHAWSLTGKSKNIEPILDQLIQMHDEGRLIGPGKDATTEFNAALKCLLDSKKSDASDVTKKCLDFMNSLAVSGKFDVRPNHVSYRYVIKSLFYTKHHDAGHRAVQIFTEMKNLYMQSGDAQIRPDLKIYTDLVSVLVKSNRPTYSVSEATAKVDADTDLATFDLLHTLLEEMDRFVNPTCWVTQGEASLSRMAWHITETNTFSISEKISLMFKLRRLADQHSVKLDHTILLVLKNFRQMESSDSMTTTSTSTSPDTETTVSSSKTAETNV